MISNIVLLVCVVVPIIIFKGIVYIPLLFIPIIIEKIFKYKFKQIDRIIYYVYVFMAVYLGGCLGFYKSVNNYDTIVHTTSGFVLTYFGSLIGSELGLKRKAYIVFFCICFSMALASCWELVEFSVDELFHQNWQRRETGLFDTMKDMGVHFIGMNVFLLFYLIKNSFKRVNKRVK